MAGGEKRGRRVTLSLWVAVCVLALVGMGLLLYPSASDWVSRSRQSHVADAYARKAEGLDGSERDRMLAAAQDYNVGLVRAGASYGALTREQLDEYGEQLRLPGTDAMGYVEIPKIGVRLPIFHGTGDDAMGSGVGHLEGSSLPVGGAGTHAVLAGHRGLPGQRLLTDIDQLSAGDEFAVHVLGQTLCYRVDQVVVVDPDDFSHLQIDPAQDLCTLVTCTPYGINTQRLLVRGHRVQGDAAAVAAGPGWRPAALVAVGLAACGAVVWVHKKRKNIQ